MNVANVLKLIGAGITILAGTSALSAATITVNNNVGAVADHSNMADAIAAASAGDTLLVAGSATSYGTATLDKPLKIVGPGYFLAENNLPSVTPGVGDQPATMALSFVHTTVSGSRFVGLTITSINYGPVVSDLHWDRCRFLQHISWSGGIDLRITRCYLDGNFTIASSTNCSAIGCNINRISLNHGAVASHCTIRGTGSASWLVVDGASALTNSILIRWSNNGWGHQITGSVTHCVAINVDLPSTGSSTPGTPDINGNYANIPFADLGTVIQAPAQPYANDFYYTLNTSNAANPALGNASDGTNIGFTGGPVPYRLAGQPSIPKISNLVVPGLASPTSGLNVKVTVSEPNP